MIVLRTCEHREFPQRSTRRRLAEGPAWRLLYNRARASERRETKFSERKGRRRMLKLLRRRVANEAGFTLMELIVVVLIVGILAAVAAPVYFGYTKDAKLAEGKALVGSVWTGLQAAAQLNCGVAQTVTAAYPKAGLSATGATTPARWDVSTGDAETLTMVCATGALALSAAIDTTGTVADNTGLVVRLNYVPAATPPVVLSCSTDAAVTFTPC